MSNINGFRKNMLDNAQAVASDIKEFLCDAEVEQLVKEVSEDPNWWLNFGDYVIAALNGDGL